MYFSIGIIFNYLSYFSQYSLLPYMLLIMTLVPTLTLYMISNPDSLSPLTNKTGSFTRPTYQYWTEKRLTSIT